MASKRAAGSLSRSCWQNTLKLDHSMRCMLTRLQSRSMATEISNLITPISPMALSTGFPAPLIRRAPPEVPEILTTVYSFPYLEPQSFAHYPAHYLDLPLRRDILHRAVVFEGDMTRSGTASTKWRGDVHGSGRKIAAQKGRGRARVGDKKSPTRRGGGIAHGPHPRDFSTRLPRKIYDLAWRTALSYRYRKGELVILDTIKDLETADASWLKGIFSHIRSGAQGRMSMLVTQKTLPNLYAAMKTTKAAQTKDQEDVDVKDLLTYGRLVIEKRALDWIFRQHTSDVDRLAPSAVGI